MNFLEADFFPEALKNIELIYGPIFDQEANADTLE